MTAFVQYKFGGDHYYHKTRTVWYRTYFWDYLSNFGGLAVSVLGAVAFLLAGYQGFEQDRAMLNTLYGEAEGNDRVRRDSNL